VFQLRGLTCLPGSSISFLYSIGPDTGRYVGRFYLDGVERLFCQCMLALLCMQCCRLIPAHMPLVSAS
jgi:hypothetical protein